MRDDKVSCMSLSNEELGKLLSAFQWRESLPKVVRQNIAYLLNEIHTPIRYTDIAIQYSNITVTGGQYDLYGEIIMACKIIRGKRANVIKKEAMRLLGADKWRAWYALRMERERALQTLLADPRGRTIGEEYKKLLAFGQRVRYEKN